VHAAQRRRPTQAVATLTAAKLQKKARATPHRASSRTAAAMSARRFLVVANWKSVRAALARASRRKRLPTRC
jgi:hypothetical protein